MQSRSPPGALAMCSAGPLDVHTVSAQGPSGDTQITPEVTQDRKAGAVQEA